MPKTWRSRVAADIGRCSKTVLVFLRNFVSETSGATAVIAAVTLPVLIGTAALSIEMGQALLVRVENQRVADIASYSGALAYSRASGGTESKENAARMAARSVAALNGIDPQNVDVTYPVSPQGDLRVQAEIGATRILRLARVLSEQADLEIKTRAVTLVGEASSACIVALAPDAGGIVLSGGAFLRADDCGVASNAAVSLHQGCSTRIISNETVTYRSNIVRPECLRTPDQVNVASSGRSAQGDAADYVAASRQAALDAAAAQFPLAPVASGTSITFGWWSGDPSTANGAAAAGCEPNPTFSNSKWTIVCRNNVSLSSLNIPSGMSVEFILENGASAFNVQNDIALGGSSQLTIGNGSSSLREINVGGGINTAGSSCLILGGAASNRIGGNVKLGGGAIFQSGIYAVNGSVEAGQGGSTCPGSVPFTAQNATFIVNGSTGTTACGGNVAFCLSGGQANISMTPPSSGIFADFSVIGPLSFDNNRGASFTQGAMGTQIKGLFYFPQGTFKTDGGSSSLPTANDCFQVLAAEIFIEGGASLTAGNCPGFADGGGSVVIRLIQ